MGRTASRCATLTSEHQRCRTWRDVWEFVKSWKQWIFFHVICKAKLIMQVRRHLRETRFVSTVFVRTVKVTSFPTKVPAYYILLSILMFLIYHLLGMDTLVINVASTAKSNFCNIFCPWIEYPGVFGTLERLKPLAHLLHSNLDVHSSWSSRKSMHTLISLMWNLAVQNTDSTWALLHIMWHCSLIAIGNMANFRINLRQNMWAFMHSAYLVGQALCNFQTKAGMPEMHAFTLDGQCLILFILVIQHLRCDSALPPGTAVNRAQNNGIIWNESSCASRAVRAKAYSQRRRGQAASKWYVTIIASSVDEYGNRVAFFLHLFSQIQVSFNRHFDNLKYPRRGLHGLWICLVHLMPTWRIHTSFLGFPTMPRMPWSSPAIANCHCQLAKKAEDSQPLITNHSWYIGSKLSIYFATSFWNSMWNACACPTFVSCPLHFTPLVPERKFHPDRCPGHFSNGSKILEHTWTILSYWIK